MHQSKREATWRQPGECVAVELAEASIAGCLRVQGACYEKRLYQAKEGEKI